MRLAVAIVASLAVLVPGRASAFCRTSTCRGAACAIDTNGCVTGGKPIYWATSCVGFSIDGRLSNNLDPAATRKAITGAFMAWSDLACGAGRATLTFSPLGDTTCNKAGYVRDGPNVHVVTFRDDDWNYNDTDNTLAKTTVTFDTTTGEIFDADIEVNTATNPVTTGEVGVRFDLQSLLTHEVGHLIGLAHSSGFEATMNPNYEIGTTKIRKLTADDVEAACAAYPPGRPASCTPTPRGGLAPNCDPPAPEGGCSIGPARGVASGGLDLTLLAFATALVRRRRP